MSQRNVEIVEAVARYWNAGDMDAVREAYDPDVVLRTDDRWPEPGPYIGRDAVMRWFEQLRDTWDSYSFDLISIAAVGDRVLARHALHGMGRGPDSSIEFTSLSTLRDGKCVLIELFLNHAAALEVLRS